MKSVFLATALVLATGVAPNAKGVKAKLQLLFSDNTKPVLWPF